MDDIPTLHREPWLLLHVEDETVDFMTLLQRDQAVRTKPPLYVVDLSGVDLSGKEAWVSSIKVRSILNVH